jgi:predicted Rdx family selenoprotein
LSTFSTSLSEVALQPSTGGVFVVEIFTASSIATGTDTPAAVQRHLLWDRKAEGGFPETKELKRRVRDVIDPSRDLGHVDRHHSTAAQRDTEPPAARLPRPRDMAAHGSGAVLPSATSLPAAADAGVRQHPEVMLHPGTTTHADPDAGVPSGIMPLIRKPPPQSQEVIEARLAESARLRAERAAGGGGGGGYPGASEADLQTEKEVAGKTTLAEEDKHDMKQDKDYCEDCQ